MALIRCSECGSKLSDKAAACPKCGAPIEVAKKGVKRHTIAGCGCLIVLIAAVAVILPAYLTSDQYRRRGQGEGPPSTVQYEVLKRDRYDNPVKTQLAVSAVVSGAITESGLKQLLQKLYEEASATRGFRYHGGKATNIFIYLYPSLEHLKSGGEWVAMLSRAGEDADVAIHIRRDFITQLQVGPRDKYGLSESVRREIFRAVIRAEDRAEMEAEGKYPLDPTQSLKVGQVVQLTEKTPLMPALDPPDPMAAMAKVSQLPPGTYIKVTRFGYRNGGLWYGVVATDRRGRPVGSGWINSIALMGQVAIDVDERLQQQGALEERLRKAYKREVAKQYGITEEVLEEIGLEGVKKHWPWPRQDSD